MTSEVVLMNRRAMAMAADSATTVTSWRHGRKSTRYFKGTNKLFHLHKRDPVGMMINGAGNMQGVPWDVLIKSYRDSDGNSHEHLPGYMGHFFTWLEANSDAYPTSFLESQFISDAIESAERIFGQITKKLESIDKANRKPEGLKLFAEAAKSIDAASFLANLTKDDLKDVSAKMKDKVKAEFQNRSHTKIICSEFGEDMVVDAAILGVFKVGHTTLEETGVIIGGFGKKDYFPSVETYACYGRILGKLVLAREDDNCKVIDQRNTSEVLPFAQSEMIYTFAFGTSIDGLLQLDKDNQRALDNFEDELRAGGHLAIGVSVDSLKQAAHDLFKNEIMDYFRAQNRTMRGVVGMLPVNELAELSETLVSIESLKQRVTTDEESVSGPIDVAVITKNDGFIWIKRKHYFKPELNPRFMARVTGG